MTESKIGSHPHVVMKKVSVSGIPSKSYSTVAVNPPTVGSSETILGWSIVTNDLAVQATLVYINGYYLSIFNGYSGTTGTVNIEVHWLVG